MEKTILYSASGIPIKTAKNIFDKSRFIVSKYAPGQEEDVAIIRGRREIIGNFKQKGRRAPNIGDTVNVPNVGVFVIYEISDRRRKLIPFRAVMDQSAK